ncbi:MAG: ABC transporter permease subunit [Planctomycetes bacterium]|nr:ABC transporter permease subunit [Planctomycetota bacterium]
MGLFRDIGSWLWRLLPANPIVTRVVSSGGKRIRHLWARLAYPVTLFIVMLVGGSNLIGHGDQSLAELAKGSTQTFMWVSVVQIFLMSFIAPVFCAAAITQEKDSNTYHILLTTPLSNGQIVLGSLFSRIYFVWVLLLSGLPVFCVTMLYGGVTTAEVFQSFALAACTGLVTGALAIMISFLKIGTRRTIFAFFVGIAVYLLAMGALGYASYTWLPEAPAGASYLGANAQRQMSWLAPLHPFLALLVVTGQTPAPAASDVFHYGWPWRWMLARPQYGYMALTTLASVVMVLISLVFVRRGAREGETTIFTRLRDAVVRQEQGELRRRPRRVWRNPIAWREASTRASAGGRSVMRWAFIVVGAVAGVVLLVASEQSWWGPTSFCDVRPWLTALVWIELAVILLVVTNTAATTLTREKESLTMELLLSTPLTSQYIIAGMLQGLVRFALPLIAVPTFTLLLFVVADVFHGSGREAVTSAEALLLAPALMIAFSSVAAMVGLQFSLLSKKTVQAVMISTAIVMGAAGIMWGCGFALLNAGQHVSALALPFAPFPAMQALIDVPSLAEDASQLTRAQIGQLRIERVITSLISAAVYMAITFSLYKNMVRSFDMTVRRQSA